MVSGLVVISNLQATLVDNLLLESHIMLFFALWVPSVAVFIAVNREYCAVSLSDDSVPVCLLRLSGPSLHVTLIVNIDNPHYLLSSSSNITYNDIVICTPAQVCLLVSCQATPFSHCCPNSHLFPNLIC